ncbi:MAG TPA: MraY family glycosyltransferase [Actinocrinis sp.]
MRDYLMVLAVAFAVTYLTTGPIRVAGIRFGAMTALRERDVHKVPTPRLGGLAMYLGMLAALAFADHTPMLQQWVFVESPTVRALLWGSGLLMVIGVIDDRWGVDAFIKLAGQALAASVMVLNGVYITWLPIPGIGVLQLDQNTADVVSILIVVVMINAVNFVDGLDGLAAGMVAIAALAFFVFDYRLWYGYQISGAAPSVMVAAIVVGMCAGFLCHNWNPARIFMGDSGAMLLGLLLAATFLLIGQVDPDQVSAAAGSQTSATHKTLAFYIPLVLPLSCLALPIMDMVMAVVRRTRAGRSPFSADAQHLHHRLLQIGHSTRRAVLIMYVWAALICALVLWVTVTPAHRAPIEVAMVALVAAMVFLLLPRARKHIDDRAARIGRGIGEFGPSGGGRRGRRHVPTVQVQSPDAAEPAEAHPEPGRAASDAALWRAAPPTAAATDPPDFAHSAARDRRPGGDAHSDSAPPWRGV